MVHAHPSRPEACPEPRGILRSQRGRREKLVTGREVALGQGAKGQVLVFGQSPHLEAGWIIASSESAMGQEIVPVVDGLRG